MLINQYGYQVDDCNGTADSNNILHWQKNSFNKQLCNKWNIMMKNMNVHVFHHYVSFVTQLKHNDEKHECTC